MKIPLKAYWDLLARHIRPQRWRFIALCALLLLSIGLQVISPQIIGRFIDDALAGEALEKLAVSAGFFLGIALLLQAVLVGVTYLGESVAWTATNALRAELATHCLRLDLGFHNQHTPGELIERIDGDVSEMALFFSQFVVMLVGNLLLVIGILVALFIRDWRLGLAFSLFASIGVALLVRYRDIALPYWKARRQAEADLFGFIEEQLTGLEDIRSNGAEGFVARELHRLQANIFKSDRMAHWKNWLLENLMGGILALGSALAIGMGYALFGGGLITVGTVYLVIRYMDLLETPIRALTHEVQSFQTIGACVERLTELRKLAPQVVEGPGADPGAGALQLSFDRVTFAYDSDEPVLSELSFNLQPGATLGLLGRTGSGKTTLARLIFRLYDPTSGKIRLNGRELSQMQLAELRSRVALVTQDVQLFRASLRDNLTFFDRSIGDGQIEAVIDELGLTGWYRSLPQGLDTQLESGARSLSAGEAQLLALTRVFMRNPGLVILDEPSSRLDPATEQHIERAIDRLLRERSAIIIAHRLGTVHRVDEILILEDGRATEYGARRALAADPASRFYNLLQTGLEEVLA